MWNNSSSWLIQAGAWSSLEMICWKTPLFWSSGKERRSAFTLSLRINGNKGFTQLGEPKVEMKMNAFSEIFFSKSNPRDFARGLRGMDTVFVTTWVLKILNRISATTLFSKIDTGMSQTIMGSVMCHDVIFPTLGSRNLNGFDATPVCSRHRTWHVMEPRVVIGLPGLSRCFFTCEISHTLALINMGKEREWNLPS